MSDLRDNYGYLVMRKVLTEHQIESHGISGDTPDTCRCGERVLPLWANASIIEEARDAAFAAHQATMISVYEDMDGDSLTVVPSALIENIGHHLDSFDVATSKITSAYHLMHLNDSVSDLKSFHPGYDSNTGTLPYEREDV